MQYCCDRERVGEVLLERMLWIPRARRGFANVGDRWDCWVHD
jgi:hypothetical protein